MIASWMASSTLVVSKLTDISARARVVPVRSLIPTASAGRPVPVVSRTDTAAAYAASGLAA
jgi:hypothetical protein